MIALYGSVDLARHGRIAVVTVDNPPANALSHVRKGLKGDRERHRGTRTRLQFPLPGAGAESPLPVRITLWIEPATLGYESPRGHAGNPLLSPRMIRTTSNY
jgi:hypothetical protein